MAVQSIQRAGKQRIVTRVRSHHDPPPGITRVITRVIKKRRKRPRPTVIHSIGHNEAGRNYIFFIFVLLYFGHDYPSTETKF